VLRLRLLRLEALQPPLEAPACTGAAS
jgi:hypothetical protein